MSETPQTTPDDLDWDRDRDGLMADHASDEPVATVLYREEA